MELSVIIVNWNSKAYVRACLVSLATHCHLETVEVVVVDSGSYDGCDGMLATEFPWVRYIQSDHNVGFARANNLGVRHSCGEKLLFLNPDTLLLEDSLSCLCEALNRLTLAGAVGCCLLNGDRTVQTSCIQAFPTVLNQLLDSDFLRERLPKLKMWGTWPLFSGDQDPSAVDALSGACLAVSRAAFDSVGGFSESYFMYGEDIDLCYKLNDAGWKVYYSPATRVVHFGGGSSRQAPSNFSTVAMRASIQHFLRLHHGPAASAFYRLTTGISALTRLALMGPAQLFGRKMVRHGRGSWSKWSAILWWSLGFAPSANARIGTGQVLTAASNS